MGIRARVRVLSDDAQRQAATGHELAFNLHFAGLTRLDEVVQNSVDDVFVEGTDVAIGGKVKLQGLGLNAQLVWDIIDEDLGEVRLAGDWAQGGKIGAVEADGVGAAWFGVGKGLNLSPLR